jgi:hypothetical protein
MGALARSLALAGLVLLLMAQSIDAAGGWYLLQPPLTYKSGAAEDDPEAFANSKDAPMRRWYRKGAFDSAKECMGAREKLIREVEESFDRGRVLSARSKSFDRAALQSSNAAECVASDDRRLIQ